jgi:hypothetical protein
MNKTLPPGWNWEGPDEGVGIFGESFYHDCEFGADEIVEPRPMTRWWTGDLGNRVMNVKSVLKCPACNSSAEIVTIEFDPYWKDEEL